MALTLTPVNPNAIPDLKEALLAAKALIDDVPSWHQGKTIHGVRTSSARSTSGEPAWFSRTSLHPASEGTFEEFWECIGVNHSIHEKEYIPNIQSAELLGQFGAFEGWSLGYKFTPLVSNRTFTFLLASVLEDSPIRQGFVITLPFDVSSDQTLKTKEPKGVRGRYVSVERIKEIDGQVEWTMATKSVAGGLIPAFLTESQMPSQISADVPHVLEWLRKNIVARRTRTPKS